MVNVSGPLRLIGAGGGSGVRSKSRISAYRSSAGGDGESDLRAGMSASVHVECPETADQGICRAIVMQVWLAWILELRRNARGQLLAELDAPLIERVDVPDDTLGKNAVLVQRHELAERVR